MARQVSLWPRGVLQERTEFKASAAGCRREQVNPAYSSQLCPQCSFVNGKNRTGDTFQCLNCGHADDADRVAAQNLKSRRTDPDITLWTPKERVFEILTGRFTAALETSSEQLAVAALDEGTVLGQTPALVDIPAGAQLPLFAWAESETPREIPPVPSGVLNVGENAGAK